MSRKVKGSSRKVKGISMKQNFVSSDKLKQGLFKERKYQKYANIVSLESEKEAKKSVKQLKKEYDLAKTPEKRERVRKVTQEAANIAKVMSQNQRLSKDTRKEKARVAEIYQKTVNTMIVLYKRQHSNPKAMRRHQQRIEERNGVILPSDNENELIYYFPK